MLWVLATSLRHCQAPVPPLCPEVTAIATYPIGHEQWTLPLCQWATRPMAPLGAETLSQGPRKSLYQMPRQHPHRRRPTDVVRNLAKRLSRPSCQAATPIPPLRLSLLMDSATPKARPGALRHVCPFDAGGNRPLITEIHQNVGWIGPKSGDPSEIALERGDKCRGLGSDDQSPLGSPQRHQ